MSYAKAKIWARRIHAGAHTIDEVPINDRDTVRQAYFDLFGEGI